MNREHPQATSGGADELVDTDEAARVLATSARHVRRLVAERRVAHYKVGRFVRFRRSDLEAFIDRARVEGGPR
jgi:excisionase family DNA binding protein